VVPKRLARPKPPKDPFVDARSEPISTFAIDVDTASYTRVRASLAAGVIPRPDDVRTEELVNYFPYSYPSPRGAAFGFLVDAARAPWNPEHRLVRIGIKGREVDAAKRPPANLVLLVDSSGSMAGKKMELLKNGFAEMVERLGEQDRVAIVAYAGRAGLVLPSTPGNQRATIINALDAFEAGGATDGAHGIQRGYEIAAASWIEGGINRVMLATDGDFNLGATQLDELGSLIGRKAKTGIFLTVLGFGSFNPNDKRLETLADRGNGQYAFIDRPEEARRVLVDQLGSTLQTIAKDVKVQVRWDPATVRSYRLLGYENRALATEDFADDRKDAGELGAGHTVTALYDLQPAQQSNGDATFGTVAIRYKDPSGTEAREIEAAIIGSDLRFSEASTDLRFAASVAAFSLLLRGSAPAKDVTYGEVGRWASDATGDDAGGQRREFVGLVRRAAERWEVAKGGGGKAFGGSR
jgi:Ca-activated chloride channel family protein